MAKHYFIGGMNPYGGKRQSRGWLGSASELPRNERASEFYKSREENRDKSTGMDPTDKVSFRGDGAKLHHEEHDQHTGTVRQIVQRSDATGSGTYEVEWTKTAPGRLEISRTRRIFS